MIQFTNHTINHGSWGSDQKQCHVSQFLIVMLHGPHVPHTTSSCNKKIITPKITKREVTFSNVTCHSMIAISHHLSTSLMMSCYSYIAWYFKILEPVEICNIFRGALVRNAYLLRSSNVMHPQQCNLNSQNYTTR